MSKMPLDLPAILSEQSGSSVTVGGKTVALFKVDGKVHAIDNTCPHRGGPLSDGPMEGTVVRCPLHMWSFDVTTGTSPSRPGVSVGCYAVSEENGRHWIEIPD
ncbi:MAG: Rieske (2Fe-2S) protein [Leptospirales bacterium]